MKYSLLKIIPLFLLITFYSINVSSHSGRTNQEGCHVNSSTGDYHCHKSKIPPLGGGLGMSPYENWCIVFSSGRFCGYSSYSTCYSAGKATGTGFQCMTK